MALAEDTIGLEEAAGMLRLGIESTRELVDSGQLPAVRLNQKHTVMLRDDVLAYIREEGRRQAEQRRKAASSKLGGTKNPMPAPRPKPRRPAVPDLRAYEAR